jgi:hypothetical protein
MELLGHLEKSKVLNKIPSSYLCQSNNVALESIDPFSDMPDLESILENKKDDSLQNKNILLQFLCVVDGKNQLLSSVDLDKKVSQFKSILSDKNVIKDIFKKYKIPIGSKRMNEILSKINEDNFEYRKSCNEDILIYLCLYFGSALTIFTIDGYSFEFGWNIFDHGCIFRYIDDTIFIYENDQNLYNNFFSSGEYLKFFKN